jgi:hypothetical protein
MQDSCNNFTSTDNEQADYSNTETTQYYAALLPSSIIAEKVAFVHTTLFSSAISTWCAAIDNGNFSSWPTSTSSQVRRHSPFSPPMIKGHMDQTRQNQRSTKRLSPPPGFTQIHEGKFRERDEMAEDFSPTPHKRKTQLTHIFFYMQQSTK